MHLTIVHPETRESTGMTLTTVEPSLEQCEIISGGIAKTVYRAHTEQRSVAIAEPSGIFFHQGGFRKCLEVRQALHDVGVCTHAHLTVVRDETYAHFLLMEDLTRDGKRIVLSRGDYDDVMQPGSVEIRRAVDDGIRRLIVDFQQKAIRAGYVLNHTSPFFFVDRRRMQLLPAVLIGDLEGTAQVHPDHPPVEVMEAYELIKSHIEKPTAT